MEYKLPTPEELGIINQKVHFGSTVHNDGTISKKMNIEFDTSTNMVLFWDNMAPDEDEIRSMNFEKNEIEIQEYVVFDFYRHEVFMFWDKTEEE